MYSLIQPRAIHLIVGVVTSTFFAFLTITPKSYSITATLLSLLALMLIGNTWRSFQCDEVKLISLAISSYFLAHLAEMAIHGEASRVIDLPSRTLLASLTLAMLYQYPPKLEWILKSVVVGAIISGIVALWYKFNLESNPFRGGEYMAIQVGGICAVLVTLSLISGLYYQQKKI